MAENENGTQMYLRMTKLLGNQDQDLKNTLRIISDEQPQIASFFLTILESRGRHYENKVDRHKQLRILVNLFHSHPDILTAVVNIVEKEFFEQGDEYKRGMISGKLFELFAAAEFRLEKLDALDSLEDAAEKEEKREALEYRLKVAEELLLLWQNPIKYGVPLRLKNPDLAYVLISGAGNVRFEVLGEAKLGMLDYRAYAQLLDSGFKEALRTLINWLNSDAGKNHRSVLADKGLYNLSKVETVSMSETMLVHLVVPANRRVHERQGAITPDLAFSLINTKKFEQQSMDKKFRYIFIGNGYKFATYQDFIALLCDETQIQYKRSHFSTEEVWALTDVLFKEYQAKQQQTGTPAIPSTQQA